MSGRNWEPGLTMFVNDTKPKKTDTVTQLQNLKSWSQNPKAYYEKEQTKMAGIKDSSIYKTLKNPRVIGVDLGHDSILEIINLIQNSGLVKKPKQTQSENLYAKKNNQRNTMETMYQSMTPIERGQFNFDLRKKYGQDYIRFRNNNKNIT